ncbi:MAG: hypothetical protein IPJ28_22490 [Betaproteobacteria bacterium]|nr:hypothetical protein [Betaproteobacteria bacterium]
MLANYVVTAAWRGRWAPRMAGRLRGFAAWLGHRWAVTGPAEGCGAAARRARFEHEARAAARAWLTV